MSRTDGVQESHHIDVMRLGQACRLQSVAAGWIYAWTPVVL
jgi:hypothetical protein